MHRSNRLTGRLGSHGLLSISQQQVGEATWFARAGVYIAAASWGGNLVRAGCWRVGNAGYPLCRETPASVRTAACPVLSMASPESPPCEPVIAVMAFLYRKWGEEPIEVRRFPFPAARPLSFEAFSAKVASAFPTEKQDQLKIHWKGERSALVKADISFYVVNICTGKPIAIAKYV